jgi:hypothetical protein
LRRADFALTLSSSPRTWRPRHRICWLQQFIPCVEGNSNRFRHWLGLREDQLVRPVEAGTYNNMPFMDVASGRSFSELGELFDRWINSFFGKGVPDCRRPYQAQTWRPARANPGLTPEERKALEVLQAKAESDQLALLRSSEEDKKAV